MAFGNVKCDIAEAVPPCLATCDLRVNCGMPSHLIVERDIFRAGSYSIEEDVFTKDSASMTKKWMYFGPVNMSPNEAGKACRHYGGKLVPIHDIRLDGFHYIATSSSISYNIHYWNVDFHGGVMPGRGEPIWSKAANCRRILSLYKLQYAEHHHCSLGDNCTKSIHFLQDNI